MDRITGWTESRTGSREHGQDAGLGLEICDSRLPIGEEKPHAKARRREEGAIFDGMDGIDRMEEGKGRGGQGEF